MYVTPEHIEEHPHCPISMRGIAEMQHPIVVRGEPHIYELTRLLLFRTRTDQRGALCSPMTRQPIEIQDIQPARTTTTTTTMFQYHTTCDWLRRMARAEGNKEWTPSPEDPEWPALPPDERTSAVLLPNDALIVRLAQRLRLNHDDHKHHRRLRRQPSPPPPTRFPNHRNHRRHQHHSMMVVEAAVDHVVTQDESLLRIRRWTEYHRFLLAFGPREAVAPGVRHFLQSAYDEELHGMVMANTTTTTTTTTSPRDLFYSQFGGDQASGSPLPLPPMLRDIAAYPAILDPYHADATALEAAHHYLLSNNTTTTTTDHHNIDNNIDNNIINTYDARARILTAAFEVLGIVLRRPPPGNAASPLAPLAAMQFDTHRVILESHLLLARHRFMHTTSTTAPPLQRLVPVAMARMTMVILAATRAPIQTSPTAYLDEFDSLTDESMDRLYSPLLALGPLQNPEMYHARRRRTHTTTTTTTATTDDDETTTEANNTARTTVFHALRALLHAGALQGIHPVSYDVHTTPPTLFGRFYAHHINQLTLLLDSLPRP